MRDEDKTKEKLIKELTELRQRNAELERNAKLEKAENDSDSKEQFRNLAEASLAGIYIVQNMNFRYVNPAVVQMFGYSKEELVDRLGPLEITYHEDYAAAEIYIRKCFSGYTELTPFTFRGIHKNGALIDCEVLARSINYKGKKAIIGTILNVSRRKGAERLLVETNQLLETILDNTHMLVAYMDAQFNFVRVNRAYAESDERKPSFFVGKNHFDLYPNAENEEIFRGVVETGEPYFAYAKLFEYTEKPERGLSYWDWSLIPIKDQGGVVTAVVLTLVNVSDRKRAEEALRESEEKWRSITEHSPDHIMLLDRDANILFINHTLPNLSKEEVIGTPFYDYALKEYMPVTKKCFEHVLQTGKPDKFESVYVDADGVSQFFESYVGPVIYSGKVEGLTVRSTNITERKRLEIALQVSHQFLRIANRHSEMKSLLKEFVTEVKKFTACSAVGIRILDGEGNIYYHAYEGFAQRFHELENPLSIKLDQCMCSRVIKGETDARLPFYTESGAFYINCTTRFLATVSEEDKGKTRNVCNQLGYESVALFPIRFGNRILGLIHVADPGENMVPLEKVEVMEKVAMQLGTAIERVRAAEALRSAHDELEAQVEERTAELTKSNEALWAEISERKLAEEARRAVERELEEQRVLSLHADRLRSLGEMATGIAHELNQPLMGVRGLAEHILIGMERGWELTEEKLRERLTLIVEQADRMSHIIEHIRMFAREAGKPELYPVQVNDVVKSAMDMLGAQFRSRGLKLECDLTEELPRISANPFSLEEVVINLIVNARDAVEERMEAGSTSAPPQVLLHTLLEQESQEQLVKIEVIDWGVGIPQDILSKVFDPFFTTKEPDRGTGLGLSISKSIVEQFGGTIQIQSKSGQGTTVILSLPLCVSI